MNAHRLLLATALAGLTIACSPERADAQLRSQSSGGAGGSLFGSGGSLFGGGGAGGGGIGAGGAAASAQFGATVNNPFTLNQPGGSGGFVGRDSTDTGGLFETLTGANNAFLDQVQRRFFSRDRGRGVNQGADARPPIRVKLELGFTPPSPAAGTPTETVGRINAMLAERGFDRAQLGSTDSGLTLSGSVETAADRRMLSRLMALEPGVERVRNELSIDVD